ncbi:MAG: glycosyltransferase [Ruminococcus sp.]|nr:glycosyltransferase [Ruminococcus sp.]
MDDMEEGLKKVLFLNAYFFPGYKSGGPQQTIANIIDAFGDVANIYVLTQNHDLGDKKRYPDVKIGKWIQFGKSKVKYIKSQDYIFSGIKKEYKNFKIIYSCGMFEKNMLAVLFIHKFTNNKKKLYIAPMGVFSDGAIHRKKLKKMLYLKLIKELGLLKDIIWSFTSEKELEEAKTILGDKVIQEYIIAEDIPRKVDFEKSISNLKLMHKEKGSLRIVFISRICEKKNLSLCIDILKKIEYGSIIFDIYGIIEDEKYWHTCEKKIKKLPGNISAKYCGEVKSENTIGIFGNYDIFLFPTKGENFGHVIFESLSAGCIPILSDTTPWDSVAKEDVGEVIKICDIKGFRDTVKKYIDLDDSDMNEKRINAINFAKKKYSAIITNSGYQSLFTVQGGGNTLLLK